MHEEGDGERDRVDQRVGGAGDQPHQRLDDPGEGRLADPAEGQARQGDAELGRREVGVEVVEHVPRQLRRAAALRSRQGSSWVGRTLTSANSAATKKPFSSDQQEAETAGRSTAP